jgi:hypothetical protein
VELGEENTGSRSVVEETVGNDRWRSDMKKTRLGGGG